MLRPLTFIVSSTIGWNPGDELIFAGVRELVQSSLEGYPLNWVLYNRHPCLKLCDRKIYSNNIADQFVIPDAFIGAGTPEWFGPNCEVFYTRVLETKKPLYLIGVGCGQDASLFKEIEKQAFREYGKLFITRDWHAYQALTDLGLEAKCMLCPSAFYQESERHNQIETIGLVMQTDQIGLHGIDSQTYNDMLEVYNSLGKDYRIIIICHFIEEFLTLRERLPEADIRYSFNLEDLIRHYYDCDAIISTRLHGALLALSLGMPSALTNLTTRCLLAYEPAKDLMFLGHPKEAEDYVRNVDSVYVSAKIQTDLQNLKSEYVHILQESMRTL